MSDKEIPKNLKRVIKLHEDHKGEWLTLKDAEYYRNQAEKYMSVSSEDTEERRKLRIELQKRFDLLEIEAVNILRGYSIDSYVEKYRKIKEMIPLTNSESKKSNNEGDD